MNKISCVMIMVFVSSFTSGAHAITTKDTEIILENLIGYDIKRKDRSNLDKYKDWGELYNKYYNKVTSKSVDSNDLKIYLILVFIAHERSMVETQADISQTFLPIFEKESSKIIDIMTNNEFIIGSICTSIKGYFAFFAQDSKKQEFKKKYLPIILHKFFKNGIDDSCFLNL